MSFTYKIGDVTKIQVEEKSLLIHICNDIGKWGAGFTRSLSKWPQLYHFYKQWSKEDSFKMGQIQVISVEENLFVANMIAQKGVRSYKNPKPLCYENLISCLQKVNAWCITHEIQDIYMPRIGCGLAGGSWGRVLSILEAELSEYSCYVFDLKKEKTHVYE